MKVYQKLAGLIYARQNCIKSDNLFWISKHEDSIHDIEKNNLPSGSGIDSGSTVDIEKSTEEKIIINTSYHHMDEHGFYDGWTDHRIIIKPSLVFDIDMKITGINRRDIKTYLHDVFHDALTEDIKDF